MSRRFESLLVREMIHEMIAGSTEEGFFGSGAGAGAWEDLFETGLSDALGSEGKLGLAKQIYGQFEPVVRKQLELPVSSAPPLLPERQAGDGLEGRSAAEAGRGASPMNGAGGLDGGSAAGRSTSSTGGAGRQASPAASRSGGLDRGSAAGRGISSTDGLGGLDKGSAVDAGPGSSSAGGAGGMERAGDGRGAGPLERGRPPLKM